MKYLAISRYGLRESDLENIFKICGIEWNSLDFSRFVQYLKIFFIQRDDGRWDFSHKNIREGLKLDLINEENLHQDILEHLKNLPFRDVIRQKKSSITA